MKIIFITVLYLSSNVSAADFKLPFEMRPVDLPIDAEAKILVPTAVETSKFHNEIQKDCSEFHWQIEKWNRNNVQISSEDYQEIRKIPLALSMKSDYQLSLKINFELLTRDFLSRLQFLPKKMHLSFTKHASTRLQFQKNYTEDVTMKVLSDAFILTFKSRDLFCDFQKGDLKIFYTSDLYLKIENDKHRLIVEQMNRVVEKLNDSQKFSNRPELQAVLFGYLTYQEKSNGFRDHLISIFDELFEPGLMEPKKFWTKSEADSFKIDYPSEHVLENKDIILKRAEYE